VAEKDITLAGDLVAGDHAQRRRLAAARGSEQTAIRPRGDLQVDRIDGENVTVSFGDVQELNARLAGNLRLFVGGCFGLLQELANP